VSCISLELQDMNGGFEIQNKFTICIAAVLVCCRAVLVSAGIELIFLPVAAVFWI